MYSGLFTGDSDPSNQGMFIAEQGAFKHLCEEVGRVLLLSI